MLKARLLALNADFLAKIDPFHPDTVFVCSIPHSSNSQMPEPFTNQDLENEGSFKLRKFLERDSAEDSPLPFELCL